MYIFVIVAAGSLRGRRGRPSQRRANLCWPQLSSARALKNYWMKLGERLQSYYRSTMRLLCQKLVKSDLKIGQYYESKVFHSIEVTQFYSYTYNVAQKRNPFQFIALYLPDCQHNGKTLSKFCSSWLHASFDTFWVQIDRLRYYKWLFKCSMKS